MLPDDNFLRRLPASHRIRFEAIVFASDLLSHAHKTLRAAALKHDKSNPFSSQDRAAFFDSIWTIVDQLHVLRQLLSDATGRTPGPNQAKFITLSEPATLMRNRMDHISSLVKNLSSQKGMRAPLFGAVTYFLVSPDQIEARGNEKIVRGGTLITVSSGSVPDGKLMFAASPPQPDQPVKVPVGQFMFSAFDWTLDVDANISSLANVLRATSTKIEDHLTDQLRAESERTGVAIASLGGPLPMTNLQIAVEIKFEES